MSRTSVVLGIEAEFCTDTHGTFGRYCGSEPLGPDSSGWTVSAKSAAVVWAGVNTVQYTSLVTPATVALTW